MSAGLYSEDMSTGQKGYNLAAVMLLGKDNVILDVCPAYRTDAILRKVNVDRYDDRLIVQTNLIESFDQLMGLSAPTVRRTLKKMVDKELLVAIGENRNRRYQLVGK